MKTARNTCTDEKVVLPVMYMHYICQLTKQLEERHRTNMGWDAIVCLKRSGMIMGAIISNTFGLPLYVCSETKNIPDKFNRILVLDDKVCTGKSMRKIVNKLTKANKMVTTATLFLEGRAEADYYCCDLGSTHKMFYEV